jgi:1-phosphofructokinase family hexose kinase
MIVTVNLNPAVDLVFPVKKLVPGAVLRSNGAFSYPGGKAANTARAAAALGLKSVLCGFTGSKHSALSRGFMKKHGVLDETITVPGGNRNCAIITGTGSETVVNSESVISAGKKDRAALLKKLRALSKKARAVVFSGSLPLCLPAGFYASCIKAASGGAAVILDTHSSFLKYGVKARPDILKTNLHEFRAAFGLKGNTASLMRKVSAKYGIRTIIVTLGPGGSLLLRNGSLAFIEPVKPKKEVSPVGCGDAYTAGLAYGLEKGFDLFDSCRLGAKLAALNLEAYGACFFGRNELTKISDLRLIP